MLVLLFLTRFKKSFIFYSDFQIFFEFFLLIHANKQCWNYIYICRCFIFSSQSIFPRNNRTKMTCLQDQTEFLENEVCLKYSKANYVIYYFPIYVYM